jgi:hypothetical protein
VASVRYFLLSLTPSRLKERIYRYGSPLTPRPSRSIFRSSMRLPMTVFAVAVDVPAAFEIRSISSALGGATGSNKRLAHAASSIARKPAPIYALNATLNSSKQASHHALLKLASASCLHRAAVTLSLASSGVLSSSHRRACL